MYQIDQAGNQWRPEGLPRRYQAGPPRQRIMIIGQPNKIITLLLLTFLLFEIIVGEEQEIGEHNEDNTVFIHNHISKQTLYLNQCITLQFYK